MKHILQLHLDCTAQKLNMLHGYVLGAARGAGVSAAVEQSAVVEQRAVAQMVCLEGASCRAVKWPPCTFHRANDVSPSADGMPAYRCNTCFARKR